MRSNYSQFYLNFTSILGQFSLIFHEFIINFQWFSMNFNQGVTQELIRNLIDFSQNWVRISLILIGFYYDFSLKIGIQNERNISSEFHDFIIKFSLIWPCYSIFIFVSLSLIFIEFYYQKGYWLDFQLFCCNLILNWISSQI